MNKLGHVAMLTAGTSVSLGALGIALMGPAAFVYAALTGDPGGVAWVVNVTAYGALTGAAIGVVLGLRSAWREVYGRKDQVYTRPIP